MGGTWHMPLRYDILYFHTPPAFRRNEWYGKNRYQPSNLFRNFRKTIADSGLVKISASWSSEAIGLMSIMPGSRCSRNQWYLTAMLLERGVSLGGSDVAKRRQAWLSSKIVDLMAECGSDLRWRWLETSSRTIQRGRSTRKAWEREMYSASMVERAVSVCNLLPQDTGIPLVWWRNQSETWRIWDRRDPKMRRDRRSLRQHSSREWDPC